MQRPITDRALPARQTVEPEGLRRERPMRLAWGNVPSSLPCRPHPRGAFDKPVSDPRRRPWRYLATPLRSAAQSAAKLGGPVVDETEEKIVLFVIALLEYALEPIRRREVTSICYRVLAREESEAIAAQSTAALIPTPENDMRDVQESAQAREALTLHIADKRRRLSRAGRVLDFPRGDYASPSGAA